MTSHSRPGRGAHGGPGRAASRAASRVLSRALVSGLIIAGAVLGLSAAAPGPAQGAPADSRSSPAKAEPVKLGIFSKLPGLTSAQSVSLRESQIGRRFALDNHYYDWVDPFPGSLEAADVSAGVTPMVTWWGVPSAEINNGSGDAVIKARAAAVREFAKPLFVRYGWEMNGDWYPWSGHPAEYVRAWRHIHRMFAEAGATNAIWVWAPNADSHPGGVDVTSPNSWRRYYPGDAYVDWVGVDGYNWGTHDDTWKSFGEIFGPVYDDYEGRKPIMIAETSSVDSGGSKAAWIADAGRWIKRHPGVRALCWFDTNEAVPGRDWRLDSSPAALREFRALARDPYFGG